MTAPPATPQDDFDRRYADRCKQLGIRIETPIHKTLHRYDEDMVETTISCDVYESTGEIVVNTLYRKAHDWSGAKANPACSVYLGCVVAEQVLSRVFADVNKMTNCNPGYDFICSHNYRIDAKSSCPRAPAYNTWAFNIKHNTTADYFLLLAFDDRKTLTPLHVWLMPGHIVNHRSGISISKSTLDKWTAYELTDKLNDVISCCNIMKSQSHTT